MNMIECLDSSNFISGLFELDKSGTVLYSRFRKTSGLQDLTEELTGRNFFDEVAGFENVKDFRRRFRNFAIGDQFADSFVFDCRLAGKTIPVRVMMLRASEVNQLEARDVLIVDIRKNIH